MNEIIKLCKCGCNQPVANEKNTYITGHNMKLVPHNKGKKHSKEQNLKQSNRMIGKKLKLEVIEKIVKANTGKKRTEEFKIFMTTVNKGKKYSYEHRKKMAVAHIGKKQTEESKRKIHEFNIGRKHTPETIKKLIKNHKGFKGKHHTEETRKKQSITHIKKINQQLKNDQRAMPCCGDNEKLIIDRIEKDFNINSDYGLRNDEELFWLIGKWCDYFYVKYNIDIEILEPYHFDKQTGELKQYDLDRQVLIANELSCMIYYIPEQEFLKNSDKEIQRLKDFLVLLDEGRN